MGAEFLKAGQPASPDLAGLARAFAAGGPAVVEVMVERDYPLSGSPAVGWWDVPVPTYMEERRAWAEER